MFVGVLLIIGATINLVLIVRIAAISKQLEYKPGLPIDVIKARIEALEKLRRFIDLGQWATVGLIAVALLKLILVFTT